MKILPADDEKIKMAVRIMLADGQEIIRLIYSAVNWSGRSMISGNIRGVVKDVIKMLEARTEEKSGVKPVFHVKLSRAIKRLKNISTYFDVLKMTLDELIKNGLKHSQTNTFEVAGILTPEGDLKTEVRDYGKGIIRRLLRIIFVPGVTEADDKGKSASYGLGLFSLKEAIESVGGKIDVTSEPGKDCLQFYLLSMICRGPCC